MAEDKIHRAGPVAPVDALTPHGPAGGYIPPKRIGLHGRVMAVRRGSRHEGGHVLDVSVGAAAHTEIVVRVDSPVANDIEGRRVTLILEED